MGKAIRISRSISNAAAEIWQTFGGANFLLNVMAIIVAICCALLVWWAVFDEVVPMKSAEIVLVVPADRVIDRDHDDDFTVTRNVCMSRGAWGTVSRWFVGEGTAGMEYKMVGTPPVFFPAGCHERSRTIDVPSSLPPGHYFYRISVEFCNKLRCESEMVQDVPVVIRGKWPPPVTGSPSAIRDAM